MGTSDKLIVWLEGLPPSPPMTVDAKREAGFLLRTLQRGDMLSLPVSRPMPSIGPRCHELRINDINTTWRIFYRIDPEAIVLVHTLNKKTDKTPVGTIKLCQRRLEEYDRG